MNPYINVDVAAIENPIKISVGINFILSATLILTAPADAWKNEPCGSESNTIVPACNIAAPANGVVTVVMVDANVLDAIVAPAEEDAVAAPISAPEIGANNTSGKLIASKSAVKSYCN